MSARLPASTLALALGAALAAAPAAAWAQGSGGDGFLFHQPVVTFSLRGGFAHATAGSDLFSFTTDQLTLGRGDFSGPTLEGSVGFRIHPRVDFVLGAGRSTATARSEDREYVEEVNGVDLPIEQTTTFQRVPVTASARVYLTPRGRSIGQFVWIPNRVAPYVGAGAGAVWYRFHQEGDFVDYQTFEIFSDRLESSGWAPAGQAFAGVDVTLTSHISVTGEAKYLLSRAELQQDFENFDPLDLSGLTAGLGVNFRF